MWGFDWFNISRRTVVVVNDLKRLRMTGEWLTIGKCKHIITSTSNNNYF